MDAEQAKRVVDEINAYLTSKPWLDFEVMEYRGYRLVIMGSLDTSTAHDVEIWFEPVFFVSLPIEWKTDTSSPPLSLVTGDKAIEVNRRFMVEHGNHLFGFSPEDYPDDFKCLISAQAIGFEIKKE